MRLNLPLHSYQLRSRPASPARLVNCYAEAMPAGGRSPALLTRSPGIKAWTTVGNGPIVALYSEPINFSTGYAEYLYVVSGSKLYYVDSSKTATLLGDIGTPNRVDIASNIDTLVVVNEPNAYYWDGTTFGQITDEDLVSRGAGDVEFLDNYLLFREPNSGRFYGAEVGEATNFDGLDFATAESAPDELVGIIADHRQLIAAGSKTTEIWENTGSGDFGFERNINGTIEKGCLSAKTLQKQDNHVFWVADDFTVRQLDGIAPLRISTHAVEQWLADVTVSSLSAFTYDQDGHFFYVLTAVEGTFAYDLTTGEWAERKTYGKTRWLPKSHAVFNHLELVGDSESNKIGQIDPETYEDWGSVQRMEWTYQPVYAEGIRAFHDRLEVILETGVGLATGQGSSPKMMMQYSDDGGKTWKSLPDRDIGARGKGEVRVFWHNLGSSRQRVYRGAVSDPVPVTITDTILEVRGGTL